MISEVFGYAEDLLTALLIYIGGFLLFIFDILLMIAEMLFETVKQLFGAAISFFATMFIMMWIVTAVTYNTLRNVQPPISLRQFVI